MNVATPTVPLPGPLADPDAQAPCVNCGRPVYRGWIGMPGPLYRHIDTDRGICAMNASHRIIENRARLNGESCGYCHDTGHAGGDVKDPNSCGFCDTKPNLGNKTATEGCSRCDCGCKYWEHDRCIDCGTQHHPRHDKES